MPKALPDGRVEFVWQWRQHSHIMAQTLSERHELITRLYKHFRSPLKSSTSLKILRKDYIASGQALFGEKVFLCAYGAFIDASALEDMLPLQTLPISSRTIAAAVKELKYKRFFV